MSCSVLEDGSGNGYKAKVDSNKRLQVKSISEGFNVEAALLGDNYNINSGSVTLTSANESAVFYFKSNETKTFIIEEIIVILGTSTGGSGDIVIDVIKNPMNGTIISTATAVTTNENRNFASSKEIDADVYKGTEGATFTDGDLFADTTRTGSSVINLDADVIVLEKDNSIGVNITPQTGNTNMDIKVALVGFLFDQNGD